MYKVPGLLDGVVYLEKSRSNCAKVVQKWADSQTTTRHGHGDNHRVRRPQVELLHEKRWVKETTHKDADVVQRREASSERDQVVEKCSTTDIILKKLLIANMILELPVNGKGRLIASCEHNWKVMKKPLTCHIHTLKHPGPVRNEI